MQGVVLLQEINCGGDNMPSISRKGDSLTTGHGCTGQTTLDTPTQSTVTVNGILAAVVGSPTVVHTYPVGDGCPPHVKHVNVGSPNVTIENKAVARIGDSTDAGNMISGSPNVTAN